MADIFSKRPGRYRRGHCPYYMFTLKLSASRPAKQSAKCFDQEFQEGGFPWRKSFTCSHSSSRCCLGRSRDVVSMEVSLRHNSFNDLWAAMDRLLPLGKEDYSCR